VFTARYGLSAYIKEIGLVFITEVESVYSAVRTECLYKTDTFGFVQPRWRVFTARYGLSAYIKEIRLVLYNRVGECLQRGTD